MFIGYLRLFPLVLIAFISGAWAGEGHDSHHHESHSQRESGDDHHHENEHEHDHDHDDDHATTEAHVHGEVMLQLALQGKDLVASLQSPAVNLVGFEQRASTSEQQKAVEKTENHLLRVEQWLQLEGGECRPTEVNPDLGSVKPTSADTTDQSSHADIRVDMQFACAAPAKLHGLKLTLLRDFPAVEKVTVQWVLETGAGESVLTRAQIKVDFH